MKAYPIVVGFLLYSVAGCSLMGQNSSDEAKNPNSTSEPAMTPAEAPKQENTPIDIHDAPEAKTSSEAHASSTPAAEAKPASAQEGEAASIGSDIDKRWNLQVQSLRAEAMESLNRGKALLAEKKYNEAIQEFNVVLNHIKWAPVKTDWGNIESEARSLLAQAETARRTQSDTMRRAKEEETFKKLKAVEAQESARKKDLVNSMLRTAIDDYDAMKFEECVEVCDRILEVDPHNADARELREAAFKSARDKSKTDYIQKKREQFRRWKEDLAETRIPYTDFITLPDKDYWNEITKKRAKRSTTLYSSTETEEIRRLREVVKTTTIPSLIVKDEAELDNVVGIIRTYTGLPIIVDPAASEAVRSGSILFNLTIENQITVKDALDILMELTNGQVSYVFKHDAILVTTTEKTKGKSVVRNHDIQDLVFHITDFIGPDLAKMADSGGGRGGRGGGGAATSPFGGVGADPKQIVNPEELLQLIKEAIAPGTWDQEGHRVDAFNGNLLVVHNEDVQRQVESFLADLRRFSSAVVTIETKFLTVSENFLQEIGVEFRGGETNSTGNGTLANLDDVTNGLEDMASNGFDNGGAGVSNGTAAADNPSAGLFYKKGKEDLRAHTENIFDSSLGKVLSSNGGATFQVSLIDDLQMNMLVRMVEKSAKFRIVNSNTISAHNGQRSFVTVVNQTSYISDYDVQVATASFIADPIISIIPDGVALDVRPVIHQNRKYITLELQPTVATLLRPISEVQTTLAGISNPVTIQLPELQVSSAYTTAVVPDGGSVLIGGLKKIRNVERKSQIPWLAHIPILGVLARTEGVDEENETLMVLIRAYITDVKEEAKKIASAND